jgi:hypothetical protein
MGILARHPQVSHQVVFLQVKVVEGTIFQLLKILVQFLPLAFTLCQFLLPGTLVPY